MANYIRNNVPNAETIIISFAAHSSPNHSLNFVKLL